MGDKEGDVSAMFAIMSCHTDGRTIKTFGRPDESNLVFKRSGEQSLRLDRSH